MKIVAVIPAHNEERTIGKVIRKTKKFVDLVIVVDDGSTDRTGKIAGKEGAIVLTHKINQGYGKSLIDGLDLATSKKPKYIITLDGDDQHDPKEIPNFVRELDNGYDVVIGSRFLSKSSNLTLKRNIALRLLSLQFFIFTGLFLSDVQSGYRGYRKDVLDGIKFKERGMGFSVESLIKLKEKRIKFKEIPIEVKYFKGVKSFMDVFKQGILVGKTIIKYSLL